MHRSEAEIEGTGESADELLVVGRSGELGAEPDKDAFFCLSFFDNAREDGLDERLIGPVEDGAGRNLEIAAAFGVFDDAEIKRAVLKSPDDELVPELAVHLRPERALEKIILGVGL